uniref:G_PROTEIN_RECEP_F1_2 domain-containing protein n=1 Tax=Panagrellus redivivus TaxID=6233 RepID=A0A7E4V1B4_PANRE
MVVEAEPSTAWRARQQLPHHVARLSATDSKVLRVVMDALTHMLNNTAAASAGGESLIMPPSSVTTPYIVDPNGTNARVTDISAAIAEEDDRLSATAVIIIIVLGTLFALITTIGNLLVMISFKVDKQLRTISNYFLFSLAVADICIGCISIPFMTYYTATGRWEIGYASCQFWLCVDYLMSNASVLNLLLISFDRYFSVTMPFSYRPRRTTKKALIMIACTYIISTLLWPLWILAWPYIEEKEPKSGTCVVQFLETNPYVTVGTAVAAFYIPVTIMVYLYLKVFLVTKRRQKDVRKLQAGQMRGGNRPSVTNTPSNTESRSESLKRKQFFPFMDALQKTNPMNRKDRRRAGWFRTCTGRSEFSSEDSSDVPANLEETSLTSSVYGKRSMKASNTASGHEELVNSEAVGEPPQSPRSITNGPVENGNGNGTANGGSHKFRSRAQTNSGSSTKPLLHSYTVLIELHEGDGKRPSVRLSPVNADSFPSTELGPPLRPITRKRSRSDATVDEIKRVSMAAETNGPAAGFRSQESTRSNPAEEPKSNGRPGSKVIEKSGDSRKSEKERRRNERKQEGKAAKTLSAILIAFIVTWVPYNFIVVYEAFYPRTFSDFFFTVAYCLCYINSTINPFCYAFCNARFRATYKRIFKCQWKAERGPPVNGLYNHAYLRRAH